MFWRCLTGEHLSSKLALTQLTRHYSSGSGGGRGDSAGDKPFVVLLLDEVDFLATQDSNVFYSFFNWPLLPNANLAVVTISNMLNLTDKLSSR